MPVFKGYFIETLDPVPVFKAFIYDTLTPDAYVNMDPDLIQLIQLCLHLGSL